MKIRQKHPWDVSPAQARAIQLELRAGVIHADRLGPLRCVAGIDVSFEKTAELTHAAVAVLGFPDLQLQERAAAQRSISFPYVPGLLSFREIPVVLDALEKLAVTPDLLLCDGQGFAHPRRFGLACHLGVLTGLPSIGVAKTRLIGVHDPVPDVRGAWVPLMDGEEVIGAALRSRPGVKPIYISVGHRISLATAVDYVMRCTTRFRLPETTRWAHRLAAWK